MKIAISADGSRLDSTIHQRFARCPYFLIVETDDMSVAVIENSNGKFTHIGELSKMLADLKKATKAKPGSNYMVERRAKY